MTTDPKPLKLPKPCPCCGDPLVNVDGFWTHRNNIESECPLSHIHLGTRVDSGRMAIWNRRHVDREMVEKIYLMTKGHIVGWYGDETIEQIIEALEKEK